MTDKIDFSGKLAKTIKIGDLKVDNQNADKELLEAIFGKDAIKDNDITLDELTTAISQLDENKDGMVDNVEIGHAIDKYKQSHSSAQIDTTAYAKHLKAIAEKNNTLVQDQANVGNGYTIQLGEDLTDLVTRVLKSQGVKEDDSDWNTKFENCKNIIIQNNPNSMKIEDGKVKWLIAGTKIYLPTDTSTSNAKKTVLDQNNEEQVIERYQKWKKGEIQNFKYKVDEDGKMYEVRNGVSGNVYGTITGGKTVGRNIPAHIANIDLTNTVDLEKLPEGDARNFTKIALQRCEWLKDDSKITEVQDFINAKPPFLQVRLKGGDNQGSITINAYYDKNKNITKLELNMYGNVESDITLERNGKLTFSKNGQEDVVANHGVDSEQFVKVEQLIKASDKVRTAFGLTSTDFVDYSDTNMTTKALNGHDKEKVKEKIQTASDIISSLDVADNIDEINTKKEYNTTIKTIKLKDGSIVTAHIKDGKAFKVNVKNTAQKLNVTYEYDEAQNKNNITTEMDDNSGSVKIDDMIKNIDAITKFVSEAKKSNGQGAVATNNGNTVERKRISQEEAVKIAQRYYDIADNDSGDSSARRIRNKVLAEINTNNVVEVWEASLGRGGDDSLIETITSEDISNHTGGGRDMAVQTAVHIMKQMIDRAREVGVPEKFVNQLEIWAEYDYSGWVNNDDNMGNGSVLPGNELTSDDDDLGDLLEPKINALANKIKEYEKANKPFTESDRTQMSDKDVEEYAGTLYNYVKKYSYDHGVYQIHKSVEKLVTKDNAAAIWLKCRNYNGDTSLIDMMTSEDLSDSDSYDMRGSESGWYKKSDGTPYTGREMAVNTAKHIMTKLVERAKELEVADYIINDVQEFIGYDFSGWIADTECLPGNNATAGDGDLDNLLEPIIDQIVDAINEKEKANN